MALAMSLDESWQDVPLIQKEDTDRRLFSCALDSDPEVVNMHRTMPISKAFFTSMDDNRCVTKDHINDDYQPNDPSPAICSRAYNLDGTINDFLVYPSPTANFSATMNHLMLSHIIPRIAYATFMRISCTLRHKPWMPRSTNNT